MYGHATCRRVRVQRITTLFMPPGFVHVRPRRGPVSLVNLALPDRNFSCPRAAVNASTTPFSVGRCSHCTCLPARSYAQARRLFRKG